MDGQVEALPGYSEMRPVTEEEKQIFDAACKDYKVMAYLLIRWQNCITLIGDAMVIPIRQFMMKMGH